MRTCAQLADQLGSERRRKATVPRRRRRKVFIIVTSRTFIMPYEEQGTVANSRSSRRLPLLLWSKCCLWRTGYGETYSSWERLNPVAGLEVKPVELASRRNGRRRRGGRGWEIDRKKPQKPDCSRACSRAFLGSGTIDLVRSVRRVFFLFFSFLLVFLCFVNDNADFDLIDCHEETLLSRNELSAWASMTILFRAFDVTFVLS